jgi:phosphatidylglycerol---prolipoprotein diacylglyceryl transferase
MRIRVGHLRRGSVPPQRRGDVRASLASRDGAAAPGRVIPPFMYSAPVVIFSLIPWFKLHGWPIVGKLKIEPFGVLVAIGIIFGSRIAEWRAEKTGVPRQLVSDFLLHVVFLGLIACAVLNVVVYEPEKIPQMGRAIASWFGSGESESFPYPGLSSFGGFLGGTLTAFWFRQKRRVSLMVLGDIFCFAFPFAWVICRSGCFVVHDHPGVVTDFFLAVDNYNGEGLPRHDLGLYEVLWSAVMIPFLLWLARKPRPWGFFMAVVPLCYAPVRFGLDFLRETSLHGGDVRYFGLTPGHYASVAMFIAGILVAVRVARGPSVQLWLDGAPPEAKASAGVSGAPAAKVQPNTRKKQRAR